MIKKCAIFFSIFVLSLTSFLIISGDRTDAYYQSPIQTCAPIPTFAADFKTKIDAQLAANSISNFTWADDPWFVMVGTSDKYVDGGNVAYPGTDDGDNKYTTKYLVYLTSESTEVMQAWFDDANNQWTPTASRRPHSGRRFHRFQLLMTDRTINSNPYEAGDVYYEGYTEATSGTSGTWYTLGLTTASSLAYCGGENQVVASGSPDSTPFSEYASYFNAAPLIEEEEEECDTLDFKCQFDSIVDGIGEALSDMFVPNGDALKLEFDTLMDFFEEKLGFLFYPFDLAVSFYDTFNDAPSPQDDWVGNVNHYYCDPLAGTTWIEDRDGVFADFRLNTCAFEQTAPTIFEFMQNMMRITILLLLVGGFYHKIKGVMHK